MSTLSSVLAWRIPGTGEPGGLPSMGLQSRTRLKRLSSRESKVTEQEEEGGGCLFKILQFILEHSRLTIELVSGSQQRDAVIHIRVITEY